MGEFGETLTVQSILNRHNSLSETNENIKTDSQAAQVTQNREQLNILWIKFKKIKEEIENMKTLFRVSNLGDSGEYLKNIVNKVDLDISKANKFLKESLESYQLRGETGVFDLNQVNQMIQKEKDKRENSQERPLISRTGMKDVPERKPEPVKKPERTEPKDKSSIKLKPIGQQFNTADNHKIILANNKIDENLYLVDLTDKKVIAHPKDLEELYTDDQTARKIGVFTLSDKRKFFIDSFNKMIISGPYTKIEHVMMIHRYNKICFAQVIGIKGDSYFINIDTGEKLSYQELYSVYK